jgi:formamidopyrimidine-DNA glycosylase
MPELPEVEITRLGLVDAGIFGRKIVDVYIGWPPSVGGDIISFKNSLTNRSFSNIARKGKYLIFNIDTGKDLLCHLRMSGRFSMREGPMHRKLHEHVVICFESQLCMYFHDTRKFGRMHIVENADQSLSHIGIDPFSPHYQLELFSHLMKTKKRIKSHLLDQSVICGIGNIYADEALFLSKIHPETPAINLTIQQLAKLFHAIINALQKGLDRKGTSLGNGDGNFHSVNGHVGKNVEHLNVYARHGFPCKCCKSTIQKIVIAQRSSHFCPICQK